MGGTYEVGDVAKFLQKIQRRKKVAGNQCLEDLYADSPCCSNNETFYSKYLLNDVPVLKESKAKEKSKTDKDEDVSEEEDEASDEDSDTSNDEEEESKSNEEDEQPGSSKKKKKKNDGTPKERRTIFVGNIPVKVDRKKLMKEFADFGAIDSVRVRSLAPSQPGVSKQLVGKTMDVHEKRENYNAYIVFTSREAAERATEKNGEVLDGFHLRVDLTRDEKKNDGKRSIFLGGLPYDISEEDVRGAFEDYGDMESVRVIRDSATGLGKGFGFIVFKDPSSVALALKMNSQKLQGRRIRVKPVENNQQKKKSGSGQGQETSTQRWRRLDQKGMKRMRYKMKLKKRKTQDMATQGKTMNIQVRDRGNKGASEGKTKAAEGKATDWKSFKPGDKASKGPLTPGKARKDSAKKNLKPRPTASKDSAERRPGGWRQKFGTPKQGIQDFTGKKMKFD